VRRQNPQRRFVPFAGGARQTSLPDARRGVGLGSAEAKPKRAQARPVHAKGHQQTQADRGAAEGSTGTVAGVGVVDGWAGVVILELTFNLRSARRPAPCRGAAPRQVDDAIRHINTSPQNRSRMGVS
jgi:hypothetical protein